MDLRIDASASRPASRCAYCKDELAAEPVECPGCHVTLHPACAGELERCPTAGCPTEPRTFAAGPRTAAAAKEARPARRLRGATLALLALCALLLLLAPWARERLHPEPPDVPWQGVPAPPPRPVGPLDQRCQLTFAGRPLSEMTQARASVWMRDEGSGKGARFEVVQQPVAETFVITEVPAGRYGVDVTIGPGYRAPGESFTGWAVVDIPAPGARGTIAVPVQRFVHLVEPIDTAEQLQLRGPDDCPTHASPVGFRWDAIPEADSYHVTVVAVDAPDGPRRTAFETRLPGTAVEVALPPTPPGGHFEFDVDALRGGERVGALEVHSNHYRAWDYRFVVPR